MMSKWTRTVAKDIEIGETKLSKGELVVMNVGRANKDSKTFQDARKFDITRKKNHHLGKWCHIYSLTYSAFGLGKHMCRNFIIFFSLIQFVAGRNLARLEAEIAILKTIQRFPDMKLIGEIEWKNLPGLNTLKNLQVSTQ